MRKAMIADMRYWLDSMNVDGYRCDVAWGVPRTSGTTRAPSSKR